MRSATKICILLLFLLEKILAQPELVVQTGHFNTIHTIAYSADGTLLASGDHAGWIVLWNAKTGDQLRSWKAHDNRVTTLLFGIDDTVLISGSLDGTVQIWDPTTGHRKGKPVLAHHGDQVDALALSRQGDVLATASDNNLNDPSLKIWDFSNNGLSNPRPLGNNLDGVSSIAFSPDGKQLVSGGHDHTIRRWDVISGSVIHAPFDYVQSTEVSAVAFSPDGRLIASGGGAGSAPVVVWDLNQAHTVPLATSDEWISALAFNPTDDRWLIAGTGNSGRALHLWNLKTGEQWLLPTLRYRDDSSVSAVAFSRDGTRFASGGGDLAVTIRNPKAWDEQPRSLRHHVNIITALALNPNGHLLASAGRIGGFNRGDIRLWDLSGQQAPRRLPGDYPTVIALTFSPVNHLLASAHSASDPPAKDDAAAQEGEIRLWNTVDGEQISPIISLPRLGVGILSPVGCLAFSNDGKFLANGGENGTIRIWEVNQGPPPSLGKLIELPLFQGDIRRDAVRSIAFSPKNNLLAVASRSDMRIYLWNITTRRVERTIGVWDDSGNSVRSVAFSPDGNLLASGTTDGKVQLWNIDTSELLKSWHTPITANDANDVDHAINSVIFFPDGKRLASGSEDHSINVWSLESKSKEPLLHLQDQSGANAVTALAASRNIEENKDTLWSSGPDAQIRGWDAANPQSPGLVRLIPLDDSGWAIIDSVGRFDSDNLDQIPGLRWVVPDQPLDALPPEIFMRDYYEPRLLQRLLNRERLKPVRSLASLNRVQPLIELENVEWQDLTEGFARVTVRVTNNKGIFLQNGHTVERSSGVYDLHILRDRQLVGWVHKTTATTDCAMQRPPDEEDSEEKNAWRNQTCVDLDSDGSKRLTFIVQVPRRADLKQVTFTAYAFNADQVKSATASKTLTIPVGIKPRVGKAYIITVGVNRTERSPTWDLQFAANDARRMSQAVGERLENSRQFTEVVRIRLVSDTPAGEQVGEATATKAHVRAVLDLLAGHAINNKLKNAIPGVERIEKAQPEDLVLIAFSSHGYTDEKGVFHMVLADIGAHTPQGKITAELQEKTLSSDELSEWLREIDAGEMVMVVDSCHSAATVEADGFKPGPMGSRGLGQLAYDKGMRILAASKSEQSAVEIGLDRHGRPINDGLLTYALVHKGLEEGLADFQPKDGKIFISEWLAYAAQAVPNLFNEGDHKGVLRSKIGGESSREVIYHGRKKTLPRYQQPVLFDFGRSGRDVILTIAGQ